MKLCHKAETPSHETAIPAKPKTITPGFLARIPKMRATIKSAKNNTTKTAAAIQAIDS